MKYIIKYFFGQSIKCLTVQHIDQTAKKFVKSMKFVKSIYIYIYITVNTYVT